MRSALLLALALLSLAGCEPRSRSTPSDGAALEVAGRLDALLADPGGGFARADSVRPFSFPSDHGPHPDFRHEWWYVTGNLDSPDAERFGFELTSDAPRFLPPPRRLRGVRPPPDPPWYRLCL